MTDKSKYKDMLGDEEDGKALLAEGKPSSSSSQRLV